MLPAQLDIEALKRRIDFQGSANDELLTEQLESAFEQAQKPSPAGCGRLLTPDPPKDSEPEVTRTVVTSGRRVAVPDARVLSKVEVDGEVTTDYTTLSRDGVIVRVELPRLERWRRWAMYPEYGEQRTIKRTVVLTGRFGFTDIPAEMREAIYTLTARMFYKREGQYADQVPLGDGSVVQVYYRSLPPEARAAFESLTLPKGLLGLA